MIDKNTNGAYELEVLTSNLEIEIYNLKIGMDILLNTIIPQEDSTGGGYNNGYSSALLNLLANQIDKVYQISEKVEKDYFNLITTNKEQ